MSRSITRRGAVCALSLLAFGAPAVAQAATPAYEQLDRADGLTGAAPLEGAWVRSQIISDDGRTAFMVFSSSAQTWTTASGIWRRDIDTNKSSQVAGGDHAAISGYTADGQILSFTTDRRLSSADTNDLPDLYAYNVATKAVTLVSRADGTNGAATGLDAAQNGTGGRGFVTRDGKSALFATPTVLIRRDLTTGRDTTVSGTFTTDPFGNKHPDLGAPYSSSPRDDAGASADGRVFFTRTALITPTGQVPIAIDFPGGPSAVSEDGAVAIYTEADQENGTDTTGLTVIDTATRTSRRLDLSGVTPEGYAIVGVTADHSVAILWKKTGDSYSLVTVNLTTRALTTLPVPALTAPAVMSRNLHFLVNGRFAAGATGYTLPGGYDLPSAAVYSYLDPGCKGGGWPFLSPTTAPTLSLRPGDVGTPVRSFALTVRNWLGQVVQTQTITTPQSIALNVGSNAYKVTIVTTYADNRTTNETWSQPAQPGCLASI